MCQGLFTYYQITGDERMRDLFLRSARKKSEETEPLTDTRLFLFYGPAMSYFHTEDMTYMKRSVE